MGNAANGDYRRKIKTIEELREIIGPRPRDKVVIMCHGTFDIVHPGHVRHLMYVREKADVLVASMTCDAHIYKANLRPFVPEQLRAMNLAALEIVDYVIIDSNATPLENLKVLQPDYFAKGYEYFKDGVHVKTQEEVELIESYGGEIIFTPGDVVYSSSAFIELAPPRIAAEKLHVLMESEGVTFDRLRDALGEFRGLRVHVVGDTIVDSYTYCSLIGGTAKTPTFSVKYERQVDFPGGAAVVAKHVRQAGAQVTFSTVMGDDELNRFVSDDLKKNDIHCHVSVDHTRPTTRKNAFIADGYRMLKVDTLDNRPISDRVLEHLQTSLALSQADIFIFSDFRHGIFSARTIPALTQAVPSGALRVADSQVANRWGNILDFEEFDMITPNEREARFALGDQDSVVRPLGSELYTKARCKYLILKLGDRGILTYRPHVPGETRGFYTIDSFVSTVVDSVGAGDALLAYATLALTATKSDVIAGILGSIAAAVACEHDGNNPVAPHDVLEKLNAIEKHVNYA
ncbi:MAG TPA: ADP-heptose synthase [Nitrospirales bacterium]|nr:ADP-heptose synthase [Nitrospirales bacterium]HIB53269.1 ADP-heptose synthase [Nitrospirales bacterium]HIC04980.1 ADP-heptose synthase [Nitrospirales bacterium]